MLAEMLTASFLAGLLSASVRMATPIVFAAMGEVLVERSGVLNLGIEGIMLMGAVTGFLLLRSEERRVGKECRSRWSPYH